MTTQSNNPNLAATAKPSADPSTTALAATPVLDREFLEIRALVLQLAAALDRVQRADTASPGDLRVHRLRQALAVLAEPVQVDAGSSEQTTADNDRAARVQLIFSRPYEAQWRQQFEI